MRIDAPRRHINRLPVTVGSTTCNEVLAVRPWLYINTAYFKSGDVVPSKHPAPVGTLAFLAECGRTVYIVCNRCNRFVVAHLQEIAQHVGWRANAQEAGKRLRCKECNYVGAKITIERPPVGRGVCPRCLRPYN